MKKKLSREEKIAFADREYLSRQKAAEELGISRQYLHRLHKTGRLNPISTKNAPQMYLREDIENFKKGRDQ